MISKWTDELTAQPRDELVSILISFLVRLPCNIQKTINPSLNIV